MTPQSPNPRLVAVFSPSVYQWSQKVRQKLFEWWTLESPPQPLGALQNLLRGSEGRTISRFRTETKGLGSPSVRLETCAERRATDFEAETTPSTVNRARRLPLRHRCRFLVEYHLGLGVRRGINREWLGMISWRESERSSKKACNLQQAEPLFRQA